MLRIVDKMEPTHMAVLIRGDQLKGRDPLLTSKDSAILLNVEIVILGEHERYRRKGKVQYGPTERNP